MNFSYPRHMNQRSTRATFVCFVGTDGAGKTTLSRAFNGRMTAARPQKCTYFEGSAYYTYLMRPFRKFARKRQLKNVDEFNNFKKFQDKKKSVLNSTKFRRLFYGTFLLFDYALLVLIKVVPFRLLGRQITAARYIYDIALKLKILLDLDIEQTHRIINWFTAVLPRPDHVFLIDIPEEVAMSRKNDAPSMSYLTERRKLYITTVLDGTRPVDELVQEVESYLNVEK